MKKYKDLDWKRYEFITKYIIKLLRIINILFVYRYFRTRHC